MAAGLSSSLADRIGRQYESQFGRPASADNPDYASYIQRALPEMMASDKSAIDRSKGRWNTFGKVATAAAAVPFAMAAGPALQSLYSGGFAAPGAATTATAAPAAGKFATLGKLFSSPGMELGVNTGLSLLGMRSQNRAADQARNDTLTQYREGLALERQRLEAETRNADLDRADAKALNDAINELKRRELDAAEEERSYRRGLEEAREARLQPYRDNSLRAMNALYSMLGGA